MSGARSPVMSHAPGQECDAFRHVRHGEPGGAHWRRVRSAANDGEDEQQTSAEPAQQHARSAGLGPGWLWWAGLVVVALPFVASAITIFLDGGYHPADVANTELFTRDVGRVPAAARALLP